MSFEYNVHLDIEYILWLRIHMVILQFFREVLAISKQVVPTYIPQQCESVSLWKNIFCLLIMDVLTYAIWYLIVVLVSISLIPNDSKKTFIFLLAICMSSAFKKYHFRVLSSF
jgi:hypothetical protein